MNKKNKEKINWLIAGFVIGWATAFIFIIEVLM